MSLSRQLILLVALLVLALFLGTFAISVGTTRDYLQTQLASHAQDAATSLGLSATAHVEQKDRAMVTAMVNAMFHRGDYLRIVFEDLSGNPWIERESELRVGEVPAWFVRAFALEPPQREAMMMSGWRQVGRVLVTSHPGHAYRQLWQNASQTLRLFLISALLALLSGVLALRWLLRPLKAVEAQAAAICNREFPVVEQRPFTLEFRRVVEAMNRLSGKVGRMLAESEQRAASLRQQVFQDGLTGLANRRQFMDVLEHRLADAELFASGGLLLLGLRDFKEFNQRYGRVAGDQLLSATGQALTEAFREEPRATLARLSGADFAVLLEGVGEDRLRDLAERAVGTVAALAGPLELASTDVAQLGGVVYSGQTSSQLLAEADMALREAQREGANAAVVHRHPGGEAPSRAAGEWQQLVEAAIREQRFRLVRQPVVACATGDLLHHEVFLRIQDDTGAREIPAALFMPVVESRGLAPSVDRAVLQSVLVAIDAGAFPVRVAVNLSTASLDGDEQLDWFAETLQRHPLAAGRLILEVPEYGATAHATRLGDWIARLGPLGVEFALDHFGKGFASFAYLRALRVHYLKVDGSFVRNLAQQEANRFFLRALAEIAHGLDMAVVADSVESEADWQAIKGLGVDAGRGFWLGNPE
ncbi:MAG: EAL domain-containing protein [Chromatiaceae bacterium]|nr:EAL domain-containing protein [Chromatiaceae bacterium]MCP5313718.1 EAL domain-containing protein [Chromatiaceae bacterium]